MPIRVQDLIDKIESFRFDLVEHEQLWGKSLEQPVPTYAVTNLGELEDQVDDLGRALGRLRPYLDRLRPSWVMSHQATNSSWDSLDAAVGLTAVAIVKGSSIRATRDALIQVLGRLEGMDPDDWFYGIGEDPPEEAEALDDLPEDEPDLSLTVLVSEPNEPLGLPAVPSATTLDQVSVADVLSGLGRLSVGAWITLVTVIVAILGTVYMVARALTLH